MKKIANKFKKNKKNTIVTAGIIMSFFAYGYAITDSTMSISSGEVMSQELQDIQTDIAELELAFFDVIDDFSLDMAREYELSETKMVFYVDRNEQTTVAYNGL